MRFSRTPFDVHATSAPPKFGERAVPWTSVASIVSPALGEESCAAAVEHAVERKVAELSTYPKRLDPDAMLVRDEELYRDRELLVRVRHYLPHVADGARDRHSARRGVVRP